MIYPINSSRSPSFVRVSLVRRAAVEKLAGTGADHYGLEIETGDGSAEVIDFHPSGFHRRSREAFSQGHRVEVIAVTWERARIAEMRTRLLRALEVAPRFNLIDCNCEHVARWIFMGRAESKQVDTVMAVVGVTALAAVVVSMLGRR